MTVKSGFFNSEGADRTYDATDFNSMVGSLIIDGVVPYGGNMLVEENTGLTVNVLTGRAWFLNSYIYNSAILPTTLDMADAAYSRIDTIVMDFDIRQVTRENTIVVVKGTPSASPVAPTLVDDDDHKQVPLANITVPAAATDIYQSNIENLVGTDVCPFATSLLQQASVSGLLSQWDAQFNAWLDNLIDQLSGSQVTNLQNQIDILNTYPHKYKNLIINGRMQVERDQTSTAPITGSGYPPGAPDLWRAGMSDAGAMLVDSFIRADDGFNRRWLRATVTTAKASLSAGSNCLMMQRLTGETFAELAYGSSKAKNATLSFLFRSNVTGRYIVEFFSVDPRNKSVSTYFDYAVADTTQEVALRLPKDLSDNISSNQSEGMRVIFWLAAGSNFTSGSALQEAWADSSNTADRAIGQTNVMAAVNNYAAWTDIQLEIGDEATDYERLTDIEEERRCNRYVYYDYDLWESVSINGSPSMAFCAFKWPIPMRDVPVLYYTATQNLVGAGWNYYNNGSSPEKHTQEQFVMYTPNVDGASGYTYLIHFVYLLADARL